MATIVIALEPCASALSRAEGVVCFALPCKCAPTLFAEAGLTTLGFPLCPDSPGLLIPTPLRAIEADRAWLPFASRLKPFSTASAGRGAICFGLVPLALVLPIPIARLSPMPGVVSRYLLFMSGPIGRSLAILRTVLSRPTAMP